MDLNIQHDTENQEFTVDLEGEQAELAYSTPQPEVINFSHTFVPQSARHKGVAARLIETGLQYAEQNNLKVIASCPAVAKYMRTHEKYQHLLL